MRASLANRNTNIDPEYALYECDVAEMNIFDFNMDFETKVRLYNMGYEACETRLFCKHRLERLSFDGRLRPKHVHQRNTKAVRRNTGLDDVNLTREQICDIKSRIDSGLILAPPLMLNKRSKIHARPQDALIAQ